MLYFCCFIELESKYHCPFFSTEALARFKLTAHTVNCELCFLCYGHMRFCYYVYVDK